LIDIISINIAKIRSSFYFNVKLDKKNILINFEEFYRFFTTQKQLNHSISNNEVFKSYEEFYFVGNEGRKNI